MKILGDTTMTIGLILLSFWLDLDPVFTVILKVLTIVWLVGQIADKVRGWYKSDLNE